MRCLVKKLFVLKPSPITKHFTGWTHFDRQSFLDKEIFEISEEVKSALSAKKPVVALESTIITHGMPYPDNVKCALEVEEVIRNEGVTPATIALMNGKIMVGLNRAEIETLGDTEISKPIKTSRRDFPYVLSEKRNGGTTVSGTILVAQTVGITFFATGGIGGVHRGASETFDISADLIEMSRSNVAVISSGVKSILDIPKTLEFLETLGVFVATYGPTTDFPAFYSRKSGCHVPYCIQTPEEAARIVKAHKNLNLKSGLLFAVPVPEDFAQDFEHIDQITRNALEKCQKEQLAHGKEVTPFLLSEIAKVTGGGSLKTNIALIKNNAKVAASIAKKYVDIEKGWEFSVKSEDERRPVIIGGCNLDCVVKLQDDQVKMDGRIHYGKIAYSEGGVARNICDALGKLGCATHFVSAVGDDHQGRILKSGIPQHSSSHVQVLDKEPTAQVLVILDNNGHCLFLLGDVNIHSRINTETILQKENLIRRSPLVILDSNLSLETIETTLKIAEKYQVPVLYEPTDVTVARKPFETPNWKAIKIITPNLNELKSIAEFLGVFSRENETLEDLEGVARVAMKLVNFVDHVVVTLGSEGVIIARKGLASDPFFTNNEQVVFVRHYPCKKLESLVNVSGAGDCFASGLIAAITKGLPEKVCVNVGFAAALTALKSQSTVAVEMFSESHESWRKGAVYRAV